MRWNILSIEICEFYLATLQESNMAAVRMSGPAVTTQTGVHVASYVRKLCHVLSNQVLTKETDHWISVVHAFEFNVDY